MRHLERRKKTAESNLPAFLTCIFLYLYCFLDLIPLLLRDILLVHFIKNHFTLAICPSGLAIFLSSAAPPSQCTQVPSLKNRFCRSFFASMFPGMQKKNRWSRFSRNPHGPCKKNKGIFQTSRNEHTREKK